jgi:Reverse transcriptase (RNA-dependent DNA polymerase)
VACGYTQIPGVDFQESYAPVINDVTFQILLVTMLTWNLSGKVIDIETAFLHGDLKETIFMAISRKQSSWRYQRVWIQKKMNA